MTAISGWQSFYVIVASSAGALIGLQFVVITLIADMPIRDGAAQAGAAFGTPTIVHFGAVLLLGAILSAPWGGIAPAAVLCGILGLGGLVYAAIVARRLRLQTAYRLQFEDWMCHVSLPIGAYAMLAISAFAAPSHLRGALFGIAAAALLLLFIGIHNAGDAVTYHVFVQRARQESERRH